jgi:hypothetical protein
MWTSLAISPRASRSSNCISSARSRGRIDTAIEYNLLMTQNAMTGAIRFDAGTLSLEDLPATLPLIPRSRESGRKRGRQNPLPVGR